MRRILKTIFRLLMLAAAIFALVRRLSSGRPALRDRFMEMCDRMIDDMPESFPPKRIMADLQATRENTERILEALGAQPDQQAEPSQGAQPAESDAPAGSEGTAP